MLGMLSMVLPQPVMMIIFSYRRFIIFLEPLNDNGTFREDVFYDTLGESYIPIALRAARAADTHAKLYIKTTIQNTLVRCQPLFLTEKADYAYSRREVYRVAKPSEAAAG